MQKIENSLAGYTIRWQVARNQRDRHYYGMSVWRLSMEEKSIDVNLGVADILKEVKDTKTVEQIDKTSSLLIRTINAALSPLEKWVMQKEYNVVATQEILKKKLENINLENIITPPAYIAVPALQAISYCMDDEQLREMFAELLAKAMNSEEVDNVHPTYVEIIKQLSPYDAVVFKKLVKKIIVPCISVKYKSKEKNVSYPISDLIVFEDFERYPLVPTQICLENLERLHLIEINRKSKLDVSDKYERLKQCCAVMNQQFIDENKSILKPEEYEIEYDEFMIIIRAFGQFFARVCLGEDFNDFE